MKPIDDVLALTFTLPALLLLILLGVFDAHYFLGGIALLLVIAVLWLLCIAVFTPTQTLNPEPSTEHPISQDIPPVEGALRINQRVWYCPELPADELEWSDIDWHMLLHSGKRCKVVGVSCDDNVDIYERQERIDAGACIVYRVRFADSHEHDAFETELFLSRSVMRHARREREVKGSSDESIR